jgi:hypothetical protein
VRESIFRMLPDKRFGEAQYVGGYWTRKGDVEVDLVGAEEKVRPRRVAFVGSIKWRERIPFGGRDRRRSRPGERLQGGIRRARQRSRRVPRSRRPSGSLEAVIPHLLGAFGRIRTRADFRF